MRRNKKSGINKERIIMLASSAFVLAALTMTGVYMKGQNVESRDDGYTLDFTALPNNADDKLQEITENNDEHLLKEDENIPGLTANNTAGNEIAGTPVTEDDLDYMPQEVGSGNVEIPGLTDQETLLEAAQKEQQNSDADRQKEETGGKQTAGGDVVVEKTLHFAESDGLQQPVQSDILMHYSMDKSTYFATLDQYKYNPATIFSAEEGTAVTACAQGKVTSIFENEEIGKALTLDLGDGYEATYGQLTEMQETYPLITHLPLAIILSVLSGKWLWPTISVLAAYLCCQLRRWVALLVIAMVPGIDWLQPAVEIVVTLPLLAVLLRYVAPAARSFARYPRSMQLLFGVVPLAGYLFDYVTRVYTDLLAQGNQAAVEFMPFVCSVAYIVFVLRVSAEERTRGQLEQTRNNLKLQVGQAVREIEALRTSQQQTRAYRHDLRHHLQYISACIENGRGEQAQEYIQSICSEIEASKVTTYCENEAANLIFSSFAGRAESCGVPLNIQAHIPQLISVAETDLCVLLSNALENALRACRRMKAEDGPAYIEVTAREKNGHLFLQFVNPCPEGIQFENGLPVTHAEGHGIGVRSICAIVEKYKGLSDFSVQDGRFILRVSL